jgi:hypothetical protein
MSNAVVSRLGQAELSGDAKALFLTVFAGETLAAFRTKTVTMERHRVKSISSGKTAQFPELGVGDSEYHTPGTEILGGQIAHNERLITIDDMLIAPRFVASIDEAMNHYDTRAEYTKDVGDALAQKFDKHVLQMGVLAARASGQAGQPDGGYIQDADGDTSGSSLAATLFTVAKVFDEKNVPEDERFFYVKPAQYYLLAQQTDFIDKDLTNSNGGLDEGRVRKIAGITLVKTNNLPSTDITNDVPKYNVNGTDIVGLAMNKQAVGTVKLIDIGVELNYDFRRLGWLLVAKCAVGHGILRPSCAIEVGTETTATA